MTTVIDLLIKHEGFRSHAYQDTEGLLTIGFGRMIDKRRGGGITKDEAMFLLTNDLRRCSLQLNDKIPWWCGLSEVRRAVLISMCFQLGINGLMKFKKMLAAAALDDVFEVTKQMLDSKWMLQTPERVLELAEMYEKDKFL